MSNLIRRCTLGLTLLAALAALSSPVLAQPPRPVTITQAEDRDGAVTAVLTVLDGAGRPQTGLPPSAFRFWVDGVAVTSTDVRYATDLQAGLSLVLAIDVSGSMAGERLTAAKRAAITLLGTLSPADRVSLLVFNQAVAYFVDYTGDHAAVQASVNSLGAQGNTSLYRAAIAAVDKALAGPLPRRAVVLLTDGENIEPGGTVTRGDALERARQTGVPVYAVGLGSEADQQFLDELAAVTRGAARNTPQPSGLDALYRSLAEELRGQYLTRVVPAPVAPAPAHVLRVRVATTAGEFEDQISFAGASLTLIATPTPTPSPSPSPVATATALPVATPAPQVTAVPEPVAVVESAAGRGWWFAALGALGLAAAVMLTWWGWRRQGARPPAVATLEGTALPPVPLARRGATPAAAPARLEVVAGPATGTMLHVGDEPVTVGTDDRCSLVLPAEGLQLERRYARLWRRDGRYMLHRLEPDRTGAGEAPPAQWLVLEDHDEFSIGPHRLAFRLLEPEPSLRR